MQQRHAAWITSIDIAAQICSIGMHHIYLCLCNIGIVFSLSESDSRAAKWGYIPVGESSEGFYIHLAGEDWASEISRPRTWDRDGPHRVCANNTPHDSST
jgi:hypothetical protein